MDQIKIGKFIAECRKKNNLTQMQLAEKLNITDRAISKWENGKAMPDSSIMLELCELLKISVNELLSGEEIKMNEYNVKLENNLIEMVKQKEATDRILLRMEYVIGIFSIIILFGCLAIAYYVDMADWLKIVVGATGFVLFIIGMLYGLKIEQTTGYYECAKCHHKYVPTFSSVNLAMHIGRTRYMKCPKCNERSWQKKVISK